jgi:ATP-dependent Lon protease
VLEIGGVKEKVLAAYRAGLRDVIMPKSNEKDLRDVPDEVKQNMHFSFVATMDEVLRLALLPEPVTSADELPPISSEVPSPIGLPIDREAPIRLEQQAGSRQ